jgi:hypothetical protein
MGIAQTIKDAECLMASHALDLAPKKRNCLIDFLTQHTLTALFTLPTFVMGHVAILALLGSVGSFLSGLPIAGSFFA